MQLSYRTLNNLVGWTVFAIALVVYLLTVAPTASFWDCGEFIACSNELEVTHPPGAPLFLLLGRIASMFSFGDVTQVAFMVNMLSVLSGALTAMLTCWVVTLLARKGLAHADWDEQTKTWTIMAAGLVAGLTCTFADSFWFNAVEAEVYAMSSLFTALVVWLIFKWEARADEPNNLRWIILIAYVMGLSIGVHLLNLLTIPALALVYYLRKYPFTWQGFIATMAISVVILAAIQYGIIQYTFSIAWEFEKVFTGTTNRAGANLGGLGLPMGTGTVVFALLIVGAVVGLLIYSIRNKNVVLNLAVLSYVVIMIGFSSYSQIFLRSRVDPAIDMNNPENILTFLSYMRREQYGDRPLLRGPLYNAQVKRDRRGRAVFESKGMKYMLLDGENRYVEDVEDRKYTYRDEDMFWFPRMYEPGRYGMGAFGYKNFVKRKGSDPNSPYDDRPTKAEDWDFFWSYQFNHMYMRYFMWNFVGRQSDIQDAGWESGIGDSTNTTNKGNNHYYFLPLLLGMLGLVWQFANDRKNAFIIGMLFFFTGIAIIIYLNQYPAQPRERDYSFAGSFQTFAIWVGLGVLFLAEMLQRYLKQLTPAICGGLALIVPIIMGAQNWDDHTRKGRYIDIEFAKNLLDTCEENGVLFTGGDNDTFPLWYIQEVEGYRTDVRVVNLELLISDWYIDQMKSSKNKALPVPIEMKKANYRGEQGLVIQPFRAKQVSLLINKEALLAKGTINESEAALIGDQMIWNFRPRGGKNNSYILRKDSVIIDIMRNVAEGNWERPIYFANTMSPSSFLNLNDYLRMEGMAYRVLPVKKNDSTINDLYYGRIDQQRMKENLLENFVYTGLNDPKVNFDEHIRAVIISNYRNCFFRLASSYADQLSKNRAAITALRANGEEVEDKEKKIRGIESIIAAQEADLRDVYEFSESTIPRDVIDMPITICIMWAQLMGKSGIPDLTEDAFGKLQAQALADLRKYKRNGQRVRQDNLSLRGSLITTQYLMSAGKLDEAEKLIQEIQDLTGIKLSE